MEDFALSPACCEARWTVLLGLLGEHPDGLDEYSLIKALQAQPACALPDGSLIEPLVLFRCHFLLFNALYRLRDRLWQQQAGHLAVHTLNTRLLPYRAGQAAIVEHDPLREFYLDTTHLGAVTEQDVVALLGQFWTRFRANDDKQQALDVLGLVEPVDQQTIKNQYRRLAMRYHPDRGGDPDRLQAIHAAMNVLQKCYGL